MDPLRVNVPRSSPSAPAAIDRDDAAISRALRAGDERVFTEVLDRWSGPMLRLALTHVHRRAVAEEVVQESWLTVLRSVDRFEGRSSFRTWVFGIVINIARARARAEGRLTQLGSELEEPSVEATRFLPADHSRWPHHWAVPPIAWTTPEDDLLATETRSVILEAIETLPPAQREVVILRDLEELSSAEVCNVLGLTNTNQRVLLHRARSRVRNALERYFAVKEKS